MSNFSPKKLSQMLVEKHDRFISEYSDEMEKSKQITMLEEKKDQLLHWVDDKTGKAKFSKELESTEHEIKQIRESFKPKTQSYYAGLKEKIEEHKKARDHWLGRIGEFKA